MSWDANNLYGWAMSQKLRVDGFKWRKNKSTFDESFMKNYHKNSVKENILQIDVEYLKHLHDLHIALSFLPERTKIKKCPKIVSNFYKMLNYQICLPLTERLVAIFSETCALTLTKCIFELGISIPNLLEKPQVFLVALLLFCFRKKALKMQNF